MLLGLCFSFALLASEANPSHPHPNIIFIMADDLGYGDIGPFGQKKIRTPNLQRLASEGTCFLQYYPGASVCSPTRCALMTGLHTGHTRIRGNHGQRGLIRVPLKAEDVTVAEVLKSAGYATCIAGKWGLGEPGNEGIPNRQGFDEWFGYLNNDLAEFYYPEKIWKNENELVLAGNAKGNRRQYSNDLMTDEALRFLDQHHGKPFFLYLAYTIPHALLQVPEDSLSEYAGKFPEPIPSIKDGKVVTTAPRTTYAAMITRLDLQVGRVLSKLREFQLEQKTIVFFCSDNGAPDRDGLPQFFQSNGSFRGYKGTLYEGGIHTPMIVWWPGKVPGGKHSDVPWAGWDFLPTAAAIAGVPVPPNLDGTNVLPALLGKPFERKGYFYWEQHEGGRFAQAVRVDGLKAVRPGGQAPIEVYNLHDDSGETRNLADQHPEFVARAWELFRTSRTESEHWPTARSENWQEMKNQR